MPQQVRQHGDPSAHVREEHIRDHEQGDQHRDRHERLEPGVLSESGFKKSQIGG